MKILLGLVLVFGLIGWFKNFRVEHLDKISSVSFV